MNTWTSEERSRIGETAELQLASERADHSVRPSVTMWVVRVGDDLCVRSAAGPDNPWYRRAVASSVGRIRAGGVERDVTFSTPAIDVHAAIDTAYHTKYDHYGPQIVRTVVGSHTQAVTIRLIPRSRHASEAPGRPSRTTPPRGSS
jgi:hypothetical protein